MKPLLLALLLLCGCRSLPPEPEITKTFHADFEKVWPAVVAEVSAGYPLKVIEKASGIIETDMVNAHFQAPEKYCIHPSVFLGYWNPPRMRLSVYCRPKEDMTFVRIRAHFEQFEYNTTKAWFECPSNGALETEMLESISRSVEP